MDRHADLRVAPLLEVGPPAGPTGQEFPTDQPAELQSEQVSLPSLVHHRESVEAHVGLEAAYAAFRRRQVEYMAVVRDDRVVGLSSRGQVGFIMGSRFGFALYSQSPVVTALVPNPLIVPPDVPVRSLLDRALARQGDSFHADVVLVDSEQRLIGLVRAETLAQLQSQLVAEQLEVLHAQRTTLRQQNLELFRANHALRQSRGLYLGLFESNAIGVALLDVEGRIHDHNRRLAEMLGAGSVTASMVSLVAWISEPDRPGFLRLLRAQAESAASPANGEMVLNLPGRGTRTFRCSLGWIVETGQICACLEDITEQRILERNALSREKQTLLDTLVGGIAHELNNKLTPVHGFADLLAYQVGAEGRQFAKYIQQSVEEAAEIIRQLLQLAKPMTAAHRTVDLRSVVEQTLAMLRFQIRAARCDVRTVLPPGPVCVLGDAAQLKQVVLNLVLNALHALETRPHGTLEIAVIADERMTRLVVVDNGCGIVPENIARIFDPFFTTKGPERGTGLGLSICYSIVRQHNGEIGVESRPGEGARFTVSLPVAPEGAVVEALAMPGPTVSQRNSRRTATGALVLVVEDDEVVATLLGELLRCHLGCRVDIAPHGAEALVALERQAYALVLSDIQMPVMNGVELYRHLRAARPEVAARFVFVTGHPGGHDLETQIVEWQVPVMAKPFALPRLLEVCTPYLANSEAPRGELRA